MTQHLKLGLTLSGKQLAALDGALVLLTGWPFENERARSIARGIPAEVADRFCDHVGALTREHFEACGLWPGDSPWTKELIARRAATSLRVDLDAVQLQVVAAALRACALEFKLRWWEFGVVAPGALDMYEVTAADLIEWAEALEASAPD